MNFAIRQSRWKWICISLSTHLWLYLLELLTEKVIHIRRHLLESQVFALSVTEGKTIFLVLCEFHKCLIVFFYVNWMLLNTSCSVGFEFYLNTFLLCWRQIYILLLLLLLLKVTILAEVYLFGHLWPVTFQHQDLWGSAYRTKCYTSFVFTWRVIHWDSWNHTHWLNRWRAVSCPLQNWCTRMGEDSWVAFKIKSIPP